MIEREPVIAVVGPCAAGKSTLTASLTGHGYQVRHVAQEHSYVQDMWERLANPDYLIYLDVSYDKSNQRTGYDLKESIFDKQLERLQHAKEHADLIVDTDPLSPDEILALVLQNLEVSDIIYDQPTD